MRFLFFACTILMCGFVQSLAAQTFAPDLSALLQRIVTSQVNTFLHFVHQETDKLNLQRPLIMEADSEKVSVADITRFKPLIDLNRGTVVAWGIIYNSEALIRLSNKQLRYQARMAVCYKQKGHLDKLGFTMDADDHHTIVKCVYHLYSEHELGDFVELFRRDQEGTLAIVGYTLGSDDEVRSLLRRTFGDPPLEHWTGR